MASKHHAYILLLLLLLTATSCKKSVWAGTDMWYQPINEYDSLKIDVLYYVSTGVLSAKDSEGGISWISQLTPEDKDAMTHEMKWVENNMFYNDFNVIAPYYHQCTFDALCQLDSARFQPIYKEAVDEAVEAFDYYMKHMNKGRRFVVAGFSQGAMMAVEIVKHMSEDQLSGMIGCYSIGYRLSEEDLQHPNIKAAKDESDKNVVISFNSTLSQEAIWPFVAADAATCINPVNWAVDTTSASFSFKNTSNNVRIDPQTNVLIVETDNPEFFHQYYESAPFFKNSGISVDNLHHWDLQFYAKNIHDNALNRASSLVR